MAIHKTHLAFAVLLAMPFTAATAARATEETRAAEQEKGQVLAVLQLLADEWNKTQVAPTSYFQADLTIVGNTPLYLFQGPEALQNWLKAYGDGQPPAVAKAKISARFLEPRTVEIEGAHAYIAIPGEWTVILDGDIGHGDLLG
jgi:hypothetical protein